MDGSKISSAALIEIANKAVEHEVITDPREYIEFLNKTLSPERYIEVLILTYQKDINQELE